MSPRAAWRLGFTKAYDYVAEKADWFAAGLPRKGKLVKIPRVGDAARRDDVTCRPTDRISDVIDRIRVAGEEPQTRELYSDEYGLIALMVTLKCKVEEVMELGPTTTRADTMLEAILERLNARTVERILVATSYGRLVGTCIGLMPRLDCGRAEWRKLTNK